MDKLRFESLNLTAVNIDKIAELFPAAITEALDEDKSTPEKKVYKKAVNFELLRDMLGDEVAGDEAYEFTWVGKREAIREAGRPIRKTLRPCVEESKNWDTTENLYIEGDNLDVLKLLQESYLGKVKMIYIDPPYNTGNDFIYKDNFAMSKEDYDEEQGIYDEYENRLFQNNESNGRFHSDWCSMIYPRLHLARNLLSNDGVIFISIDENEENNMRKICDEIFGQENFIDTLHWKKKKQPSFLAKHTAKVMEYVVVYSKKEDLLEKLSIETLSDATKKVINISNSECTRHFDSGVRVKIGEEGVIKSGKYKIKTMEVNYLSDVQYKNGRTISEVEVTSKFSVSQDKIDKYIEEDLLFITTNYGLRRDVSDEEKLKRKAITDLLLNNYGDNQDSDNEFKELFGEKYFDYTKPVNLILNLVKSNYTNNEIILDFFSGSATTAHAVMQLNAEDSGKRKFIMVQLPEVCPEDSEAYKVGYKNICEIGKERIRRAGEKIKEEAGLMAQDLDIGFRVLKLADTNMKDVYYAADEYNQDMLAKLESNIKDDRTDMDLLYGCLMEWGLPLSMPHTHEEIDGVVVHTYNKGDLMACFAPKVSEKVVKEIARRQPLRVVFRDSSFSSSPEKINVEEIFKLLAPKTSVKVL